ncbi:branched-chain amino acid ABC transporter permease [Aestuariivirga sp. YIM B02566]|uniref:Branched-chain amino acid ABC transporter permease n=1 Tax=Taklimakanibacter albus TaxID=2800327 RepID=A0ACC5REX1_9HYPH|nr:branched-chain amino acid ABC transporter permease [Aestuariivirga sp. YIM B02566]MBK1871246.1 branched-chain amino acid ABC transporter permease [Aestuariivirga sp. YIM B02566]
MLDILAYAAFFLVTALTYGIICLGLNVQWGQTGLFNVGVAGFVAIGAYVSALLTTPETAGRFGGLGLPVWFGWIAAMVVSGAAAALIGAITLRLRADYLAITTFGIAIAIQLVALNAETVTGGPFGIGFIPRAFGGLEDRPIIFNLANLALVGAVTALLYYALERLVRSPWGRVLRAIREDEAAALSLGKNANLFRIQAFALGSAIMGLAGAVQAHFIGFIAPENYISTLTFQVWAMLIIGGSGNNRGALLGAVLVWGLWSVTGAMLAAFVPGEYQARAAALQIVLIGVALAALLVLRPRGLLGEEKMISRFLKG